MRKNKLISEKMEDFNNSSILGQKVLYFPAIKQLGCNEAVRTRITSLAGFCKKHKKSSFAKVFIRGEKECVPFHTIKFISNDIFDKHDESLVDIVWSKEHEHYW